MKSWKTTVFGVMTLVGSLVAQFYPNLSTHGLFISSLGAGLGLMFARDNNVSSEALGINKDKSSEAETKKD